MKDADAHKHFFTEVLPGVARRVAKCRPIIKDMHFQE
jgi:hypothetical protein